MTEHYSSFDSPAGDPDMDFYIQSLRETAGRRIHELTASRRLFDAYMYEVDAFRDEPGIEDLEQRYRDASQRVNASRQDAGLAEVPLPLYESATLHDMDDDLSVATRKLDSLLGTEERDQVYDSLSMAMRVDHLGSLFSPELVGLCQTAYAETIANLAYSFIAIKTGLAITEIPGSNGRRAIQLGSYTVKEAAEAVRQMSQAVQNIMEARKPYNTKDAVKEYDTGITFMYRLPSRRGADVLEVIRKRATSDFDTTIEYGGIDGAQASIGYTIGINDDTISKFKDEQEDLFCVRVDNEGTRLALDMGSLLSRVGTLDKTVADLLAIGSHARSLVTRGANNHNHNPVPFKGTGLEDPDKFEQLAQRAVDSIESEIKKKSLRVPAAVLINSTQNS